MADSSLYVMAWSLWLLMWKGFVRPSWPTSWQSAAMSMEKTLAGGRFASSGLQRQRQAKAGRAGRGRCGCARPQQHTLRRRCVIAAAAEAKPLHVARCRRTSLDSRVSLCRVSLCRRTSLTACVVSLWRQCVSLSARQGRRPAVHGLRVRGPAGLLNNTPSCVCWLSRAEWYSSVRVPGAEHPVAGMEHGEAVPGVVVRHLRNRRARGGQGQRAAEVRRGGAER